MRILIGAPVRQDVATFKLYLESLKALNTEGIEVDYFFFLHNSPHLKQYLLPEMYEEWRSPEEYVRDEDTHHWNTENLSEVVLMKNQLLLKTFATEKNKPGYDAFFLVDSDLLLHPETLQHLVKANKPIVSNVFWTRWEPGELEMPNAWNFDQYSFRPGEIERWQAPGVYQVGMTGACILIRREVIEAGVNYWPIYNVSHSLWEDRAFCIRAACAGFPIYMDTTYPARHLYRDEDVQEVLRNAVSS